MRVAAWALAFLSVAASAAETPAPVPRIEIASGAPGRRVSSTGEALRWHQPVVKLHVDDSLRKVASDPQAVVARALETWQAVPAEDLPEFELGQMQGAEVKLEPDGINAVLFAHINIADHEDDLAVTVTFSDDATGAILETDVIVNARYKYAELGERLSDEPCANEEPVVNDSGHHGSCDREPSVDDSELHSNRRDRDSAHSHDVFKKTDRCDKTSDDRDDLQSCRSTRDHCDKTSDDRDDQQFCRSTYDLESLMAHEAGHVLGLGEDIDDREATMYYKSEPCDTRKRTLVEGDASAIRDIYVLEPPGEASELSCSIGKRRGQDHGPDMAGGLGIAALALLMRRRRQGRRTD